MSKSRSCGHVGCALFESRGDLSGVADQDLDGVRNEMRGALEHLDAEAARRGRPTEDAAPPIGREAPAKVPLFDLTTCRTRTLHRSVRCIAVPDSFGDGTTAQVIDEGDEVHLSFASTAQRAVTLSLPVKTLADFGPMDRVLIPSNHPGVWTLFILSAAPAPEEGR